MYTEENNILAIAEDGTFYILFEDTNAQLQKVEVTETIYNEFMKFKRTARNMQRSDERHIEFSDFTDIQLFVRCFSKPKSMEDTIIEHELIENIFKAIEELPKIQHRRFILYFIHGLTLQQIADIEKCSKVSIKRSIDRAKKYLYANCK